MLSMITGSHYCVMARCNATSIAAPSSNSTFFKWTVLARLYYPLSKASAVRFSLQAAFEQDGEHKDFSREDG